MINRPYLPRTEGFPGIWGFLQAKVQKSGQSWANQDKLVTLNLTIEHDVTILDKECNANHIILIEIAFFF